MVRLAADGGHRCRRAGLAIGTVIALCAESIRRSVTVVALRVCIRLGGMRVQHGLVVRVDARTVCACLDFSLAEIDRLRAMRHCGCRHAGEGESKADQQYQERANDAHGAIQSG